MDVRNFFVKPKPMEELKEVEPVVEEEDDDVIIADPTDELIRPIQNYAKSFVAKEMALEALLPVIIRRFPTIYAYSGSSREVKGLFEASLPPQMKAHVDIFRQYRRRKINTIPPEDREKLQIARDEWPKINGLVIKMISEVARYAYGSDIPKAVETPRKTASVNENDQFSSTKKSVVDEANSVVKTPVVEKDVEDLQASLSAVSLNIKEGSIVKEKDQETGEIIEGEELGKVGGKYDLADEEQEKKYEKEDGNNQRKVILKTCIDFLNARLDKIIDELGADGLVYVSMKDPFIIRNRMVNDVLELVNVEHPLLVEEEEEI